MPNAGNATVGTRDDGQGRGGATAHFFRLSRPCLDPPWCPPLQHCPPPVAYTPSKLFAFGCHDSTPSESGSFLKGNVQDLTKSGSYAAGRSVTRTLALCRSGPLRPCPAFATTELVEVGGSESIFLKGILENRSQNQIFRLRLG